MFSICPYAELCLPYYSQEYGCVKNSTEIQQAVFATISFFNEMVKVIVNGDLSESNMRILKSNQRKVFRNGGVDSFIMSVNRPLGKLNYLRVWHDNSGKSEMASWFLKYIIVHDLQTRERFYFLCNNWLAVERADGKIDRTLGVASEKQVAFYKYNSKSNLYDAHIWLSIFTKPVQSTLNRLDRVGCCYVLIFIFMLANILYYDTVSSSSTRVLSLGPFSFSIEQVAISAVTNLMMFPPCFFLIFLFKRSKTRSTRSGMIRKAIEENIRSKNLQNFNSLDQVSGNIEFNNKSEIMKSAHKKYLNETKNPDKKRKKILLPWWTKIIGHIICVLIVGGCAFFIYIKGVEFGDAKVGKWLASLIICLLTSIFLTQPVQVFLISIFIYKISKKDEKEISEFQFDYQDNGSTLNKYFKFSDFSYKINPFRIKEIDSNRLSENEIVDAREYRIREVRIWKAIKEITVYLTFISVLYFVVYSNIGLSTFGYQQTMRNNFDVSSVVTVEDLWNWSIESMAPGLRATVWYNKKPPYNMAGYLRDYTSRMVGYALIRQVRVGNNSCSVNNQLRNKIDFCDGDYSLLNGDTTNYGFGWDTFNSSFVPPYGTEQIYNAFQYQTADELQGYPYTGTYNTYQGDGYVYQLRGSLRFIKGNLTLLHQLAWIDRQTRAVFVEFAVYNPNINMFMVACILFEILPSGNILKLTRFDPLNLFNEINGDGVTLKIAIYFVYIVFISYFMIMEMIEFYKSGWKRYLSQFWNYIEWLMIIFSWVAFGLFFYRLSTAYQVLDFFKKTSGYGYIKLQKINDWNQVLTITLAGCAVFGTLKFLKLLRFNKKIYALALTLKFCLRDLMGFGMVFLVLWLAFVILINLLWYESQAAYYTIFRTMTTTFQILLGKFDATGILAASRILGPLVFAAFHIIIIFTMINIFISIVCDGFKIVRIDISKKENELEMIEFFREKYKNNNDSSLGSDSYIDVHDNFKKDVDRIIDNFSKAYEEKIMLEQILSKGKPFE